MQTNVVTRRFGIADGLILIGAVAVGLAASRAIAPDVTLETLREGLTRPPADGWSVSYLAALFTELGSFTLAPWLASGTCACLLMQLRGAQPDTRQWLRQPGVMAMLVGTIAIVLSLLIGFLSLVATRSNPPRGTYELFSPVILSTTQVGA